MAETAFFNSLAADPQTFCAQPQPTPTGEPNPDHVAAAVARCQQAWRGAYDAYVEQANADAEAGFDSQPGWNVREILEDASKAATKAYRDAMPPLSSRGDIRCYVACVNFGVLSGAIPERLSHSLLYGAQVATSTFRGEPRPVGRPRKSEAGN
jgi:hypothetical protein